MKNRLKQAAALAAVIAICFFVGSYLGALTKAQVDKARRCPPPAACVREEMSDEKYRMCILYKTPDTGSCGSETSNLDEIAYLSTLIGTEVLGLVIYVILIRRRKA